MPVPTIDGPAPDATREPHEVTRLLAGMRAGDAAATERLARLVYAELRVLARAALRRERDGRTLQPTELVHETFLRLMGGAQPAWQGRGHFYGVAARVMRQVLVERARARRARKRDGGVLVALAPVPSPALDARLAAAVDAGDAAPLDLLALDAALTRLAARDPRQARVVELRYFGGLALPAVAELLEVSLATVKRDWTFARAWLRAELDGDGRLGADGG